MIKPMAKQVNCNVEQAKQRAIPGYIVEELVALSAALTYKIARSSKCSVPVAPWD